MRHSKAVQDRFEERTQQNILKISHLLGFEPSMLIRNKVDIKKESGGISRKFEA